MIDAVTMFISQTVVYTTIYSLVALGIVISGRAGIFNIFGEGIMLASAAVGFISAYLTGKWLLGFVVGALMGGLIGLMFIYVHESFKINQFLLGVIFFIFGMGLSDLIYKLVVGLKLLPPMAPVVPVVTIPLVSGIPVLSGFLNQNCIVYFMYFAILVSWWFFYRTKYGLEIRAIGEDPKSADVVGVNVVLRRYVTTISGSLLIGVAGAYLPLVVIKTYSTGISGGRGFMAIGIAIFASWKPQRVLLGGLLFAAVEVMSFKLQLALKNVPYQLFLMLPFIVVIVVMMIFKKQIEFPASVGKPYSRE